MKPERLPLLDGLRGLAALFVFSYHEWNSFGIGPMFARGYLMVDLFFLLSGFVLALVAEPKLQGGWSSLTFLKARYIRLWPIAAAGACIGIALAGMELLATDFQLSHAKWLFIRAIFALAILPTPRVTESGALYPFNGPHWSLLLELLANCTHAFVLYRLRDSVLLALTLVFGAILAGAIYLNGLNSGGPFFVDWYYGLPRVGFSYTLGIWLARKWRTGRGRMPGPWWLALLLPIAATAAVPYVPLALWIGDSVFVLLIVPALFWVVASSTAPAWAESALTRLGLLSYPLYATHGAIFLFAKKIDDTPIFAVLVVIVALALSWLLANRFERPRNHAFARAT